MKYFLKLLSEYGRAIILGIFISPVFTLGFYMAIPAQESAIADPKSFMDEARQNLSVIAANQLVYFGKFGEWAGQSNENIAFKSLAWSPKNPNHYAYYCGKDYIQSLSGKYPFNYPSPQNWPYKLFPNVSRSNFICMAIGNNDDDAIPDLWMIDKARMLAHLIDDATDRQNVDIINSPLDVEALFAPKPDPATSVFISRARIEINIPAYRLDLFQDEILLSSYPIAVGMSRYKSPRQQFLMESIEWNPWWYPPPRKWAENDHATGPGPRNPLGPVKMVLDDGFLIHGTNKPKSIGSSASHGCIRMFSENAKDLAWKISVLSGTKKELQRPEEYAKKPRTTFKVALKNKVRVNLYYNRMEFVGNNLAIYPDIYRWQRIGITEIEEKIKQRDYVIGDIDPLVISTILSGKMRQAVYIYLPKK